MAVVEADVEGRARLARDDVARRIADVDRGDLQVRRLEPLACPGRAASAVSAASIASRPVRGIVGALRIGGMALDGRARSAGRSSEPRRPILIVVAEPAPGRSARRPGRHRSRSPCSAAQASSLRVPLTAGPSSSPVISRLIEPAGRSLGQEAARRRDEGGDAALHVGGAPAVELAVLDLARERVDPPGRRSPGGTTSTWPAKRDAAALAQPGVEIVDRVAVRRPSKRSRWQRSRAAPGASSSTVERRPRRPASRSGSGSAPGSARPDRSRSINRAAAR